MELKHYGTPRHSGRYPWGSGKDPFQSSRSFLSYVDKLRKDGLSEVEIARGLGITTSQLRAKKTLAKAEKWNQDSRFAMRLKEKGYSNVAIAERMGIGESQVRNLLKPAMQERFKVTSATADALKARLAEKGLLDVGSGVEHYMGISQTKLKATLDLLKEEGYGVQKIYIDQVGTGKKTTMLVLSPPGMTYAEVYKQRHLIAEPDLYSENGGRTWYAIETPTSLSSKRVQIKYAEDGGKAMDGVIELRRGLPDLSLGASHYAQVRIAVDGTHYLKGMAMYSDDLPDGIDVVFNTNKKRGTAFTDVLKPMKDDADNPFGALIRRQYHYTDADGNDRLSPINIVNEEGAWAEWSKTLSSQVLSKQPPSLAKRLLGQAYSQMKDEYDSIMALTNPTVRKKLLDEFAEECDSKAVSLKACGMKDQATHVILPFPDMKEDEIYAPNYKNGTHAVLIRYPHGGIFEIPEVTVNNNHKRAKSLLGNAKDAIGINPKVAEQLSGADFDGDTVLVIPDPKKMFKTSRPLDKLKDFEPKDYKLPEGATRLTDGQKEQQMGVVSNLITDMTIKGADADEIARAVRHSMVVIDSVKHGLDVKRSAEENGIAELKKKYQGGERRGASTLVSKASSEARPDKYRVSIDPETGRKIKTPTGETYIPWKKNAAGEWVQGKETKKTIVSTKMAETEDPYTLSSGTVIETVYAEHASKMKALGNAARKSMLETPRLEYSPQAKRTYASEVESLDAKLREAEKARPLERKAQLLTDYIVDSKIKDNPELKSDKDALKKVRSQTLEESRVRIGSKKTQINITDREWEAIQAGAISDHKLSQILDNTDADRLRALATPRKEVSISASKLSRARAMLAKGVSQADVAEAIGVSTTTLLKAL